MGGDREWEGTADGYGSDENVLELGSSDGCTAL